MGLVDVRSVGARIVPTKKIASITSANVNWSTTGNSIFSLNGILTRNAVDRTFYLYNGTGFALTLVQIYITDSLLPNQNMTGDSFYDSSPSLASGKIYIAGSKGGNRFNTQAPYLANIGDSVTLVTNIGANVPTGNLDIYLAERF